IAFVGNALFITYFLIGGGMMRNVRVVGQSSTLTIAAIMLAVALAGKWLPAWAAQKIFKMPGSARRMMFGLTTAHTAVALAVVTIGYNMTDSHGNRLIDETILNGTILVILFTCAIAPIVTAGAAARIKISMLEDGETDRADEDRHQSENILIPVANPLTAGSLVEMAMLMRSRNRSKGDNLYALHVRGDNSRSSKAVGRNSLEIAQKAAASTDTQLIPIERFDLNTVTGIVNTIEERDITGVVLGMHRKSNVVDTFLGTKIEQLQRLTNRMLIISRCYIPLNTVRRIIVYVPSQAEYETGFPRWVKTIASLSAELGCRIIFYSEAKTELLLRGVIYRAGIQTRAEYKVIDSQDDFILIAGEVTDDDLFVTVCARANSVSYSATMAEMPNFLQRYFANNNLLIVFPEQFGENAHIESFIDPHLSDLSGTPPALWSRLTTRLKKLRPLRKKKNESKQYN
ncbi:MAG: cation:proton antiporter, partial [Muribaculaceae bacterium]|nr:cation:proton antiporter [Muribaculaceae bacterium]